MRGSVALVYFVLVVNVVKAVNIAKRYDILRERALYKCISLTLSFRPDITAMVTEQDVKNQPSMYLSTDLLSLLLTLLRQTLSLRMGTTEAELKGKS